PSHCPPPRTMHLVSCARPIEPLEDAPRSSLLLESGSGSWTGYWSTLDEGYYARWRCDDGGEEGYRLVEDGASAGGDALSRGGSAHPASAAPARRALGTTPAVTARRHVMLLLARSASARGILVGSARPKTR